MTSLSELRAVRRKAVWGPKRILTALAIVPVVLLASTPDLLAAGRNNRSSRNQSPSAGPQHSRQAPTAEPGRPSRRVKSYKVDDELRRRSSWATGTSRVIVTMVPGASLPPQFRRFARRNGRLGIISGQVLELPNHVIRQLESRPEFFSVHHDRPIELLNYRTSITVGARTARFQYGYKGAGVGVAVIDSGITTWHDDLSRGNAGGTYPYGDQRVAAFVDFVNGASLPYDDNGHGTHIAGIIAGNGFDSSGSKGGIAPEASIVSLKVLDGNGLGTISNIIAALDWVAQNHATYNIRVVNLSVGARIRESYWTDPLTLAAKAVVDRGIVVVGASGNFGKNALGSVQYGGITAPSNAPWVLTVGASSSQGTSTRRDDVMAGFSSNGPTDIDFSAKPDLVAPGVGTVSLAATGSRFYFEKASALVSGSGWNNPVHKPYLTLSGTSMAAPVVTGTVALMLQANPSLTPNLVKAILQYTAEQRQGYNALRQGAGFLNTLGAVRLSRFYAANQVGAAMPIQGSWSQQILWGNHRITGGYLNPLGNAWSTSTIWGAAKGLTSDDNIVWGTECGNGCDNIVWGTHDANGDNIVWGTDGDDNIVWGTSGDDNIVWGTMIDGDNIVWGTNDDNIVWGTDCGSADCDNIVWGTADEDNIVWGTADEADNIVWGTNLDDNIVWGTSGAEADAVVYADTAEGEPLPDEATEFGDPVTPPAEGDATAGVGAGAEGGI